MREERRIGSVLEEAIARIKANIDAGQQVRDDDFLDAGLDDRAAADEMCEAAIRAAQVEFEERKIPFQGYLIANILFHHEVDREQANLLMRLASELSYRQLCLLSLFNRAEEFDYFFLPSIPRPSRHDYDDD